MPVILADAGQESWWIDGDTAADALHALCRGESAPALEYRPVSRTVNDARFDGPQCLDPPEQASLF